MIRNTAFAEPARLGSGISFNTFGRKNVPPSTTVVHREPVVTLVETKQERPRAGWNRKIPMVRERIFEPFVANTQRL